MASKSCYELWVKACEEQGMNLWLLVDAGLDTKLLKINKTYMLNNNTHYSDPMYIGWIDGKWEIATKNYQEAVDVWERKAGHGRKKGVSV